MCGLMLPTIPFRFSIVLSVALTVWTSPTSLWTPRLACSVAATAAVAPLGTTLPSPGTALAALGTARLSCIAAFRWRWWRWVRLGGGPRGRSIYCCSAERSPKHSTATRGSAIVATAFSALVSIAVTAVCLGLLLVRAISAINVTFAGGIPWRLVLVIASDP